MDNYKQIKVDLDELRLLVEKSELWVYKAKSSSEEGSTKKQSPDKVGTDDVGWYYCRIRNAQSNVQFRDSECVECTIIFPVVYKTVQHINNFVYINLNSIDFSIHKPYILIFMRHVFHLGRTQRKG